MAHSLRYRRRAGQEGASILGLAPPPTRRDELAEFLRRQRERTTPEQRRPAGRRPAAHAGPAPRGGLAARRGRAVLVHVARAGPRHHAVRERARRARAGPRPRPARARAPVRPRRRRGAGRARTYPTEAPAELREIVRGARAQPGLPDRARAPTCWSGTRRPTRMLGEPSRAPDGVQNLLWWMFTDPRPAGRPGTATARNTLARFRAEHARRYGDPAFRCLIEALLGGQPGLRELWPRHEVLDSQLGTKVIDHPELGSPGPAPPAVASRRATRPCG